LPETILKLFHVSIQRIKAIIIIMHSLEQYLSPLPTDLANTQTSSYYLFKNITGPFSGLVI